MNLYFFVFRLYLLQFLNLYCSNHSAGHRICFTEMLLWPGDVEWEVSVGRAKNVKDIKCHWRCKSVTYKAPNLVALNTNAHTCSL